MLEHPIFGAIEAGSLEAVQQFVAADRDVLTQIDDYGQTPLKRAIDEGEPVIAVWLVERMGPPDLDLRDESIGSTDFESACSMGQLSVVKALIAAGAGLWVPCHGAMGLLPT